MRIVAPYVVAMGLVAGLAIVGCDRKVATEPCAIGAEFAAKRLYQDAFQAWQAASLEATPKEYLRASLTCIKREGLAEGDRAAVRWIIARAEEGVPAARLFAGMLLASGGGVEQDLRAGRKWLEEAQADYPDDAAMLIGLLDAAAQDQESDLSP